MTPFDIAEAARPISGPYENKIIANTNDHVVRMSVMTEPFYWHRHPNSDETFVGVDGVLLVEMEDQVIALHPGQVLTVAAGQAHCTRPRGERSVNLTFERRDATTERL